MYKQNNMGNNTVQRNKRKKAYPKNITGKLNTNALQVVHKLRKAHLLSTMLEKEREGGREGWEAERERERDVPHVNHESKSNY